MTAEILVGEFIIVAGIRCDSALGSARALACCRWRLANDSSGEQENISARRRKSEPDWRSTPGACAPPRIGGPRPPLHKIRFRFPYWFCSGIPPTSLGVYPFFGPHCGSHL